MMTAMFAMPAAAQAARGSRATAAAATATTSDEKLGDHVANLNPNLIQLPEATRRQIDSKMVRAGDELRSLALALHKHMQDPWSVEDVWLILVWHFAMTKG